MHKAGSPKRAYAIISRAETYDKANATAKMVEALSDVADASSIALCDSVIKQGDEASQIFLWYYTYNCRRFQNNYKSC